MFFHSEPLSVIRQVVFSYLAFFIIVIYEIDIVFWFIFVL